MKLDAESLKTGGQWVGAASGVGVPAYTFFSSFPPPLFPKISIITATLSAAILFIALAWRPQMDRPTDTMPRVVRFGGVFISAAVLLLVAYVLLFSFTTIGTPSNERLQIGFGKARWTLTDAGREWVKTNPSITVRQMVENEAAFDQDRLTILWQTWSIYVAGGLLIVLYFLGFASWTSGFALLTKQRTAPSRSS